MYFFSKKLLLVILGKGMCCWFGLHFHDFLNYNGVTFSVELQEWGLIHFHDLEKFSYIKIRIYKQEGSKLDGNVPECECTEDEK